MKTNLFLEHILYEMYMYLWSHNVVRYDVSDIYLHNSIWISYNTSLRNLLYFFSMRLNYNERLNDILYKKFSFDGKNGKFVNKYKYKKEIECIDKSVAHLTTERYYGLDNKDLKKLVVKYQKKFYPMMIRRINDFIYHLKHDKALSYNGVQVDFKHELRTKKIKWLISEISNLIENAPKVQNE